MKLPDIMQQPVGEYAKGNIARPNYARRGRATASMLGAAAELGAQIYNEKMVGDIDEATGEAANEITELRAKLVNSNTLPLGEIPEDLEAEFEIQVPDGKGGREGIEAPVVFTHDVYEALWDNGTQEIIDHYASTIKNKKAKDKFIEEIQTRYVVPGTLAVVTANTKRIRAYGQARAETSIDLIAASGAPTEVREQQIKEVISRQLLLGADPTWAESQLAAVGPMIDQLDVQNAVIGTSSQDELDQIEENMWAGGTRMSPEQMRTMSSQMDKRRQDFKNAHAKRQDDTAGQMMIDFVNGDLTAEQVANVRGRDGITQPAAWTFLNGLKADSTTKVSSPFTLSQYKGEIFKLQYTGNNMRVSQKGALLKLMVSRGAMGLTPQGVPTGMPATISGVDALELGYAIDKAMKEATEDEAYDNALGMVLSWTRSKLDLEGQVVTKLGGNQNQVEAAVAFKKSLDNYMDAYGADANAVEFFESNKDAYDPRNFSTGVNGRFLNQVPQATPYITERGDDYIFTTVDQDNFVLWLSDNMGAIGPVEADRIMSLFNQYYQGQGIAPDNGRLMLEPDDPLYWQFQSMIPDNE